MKLYGGSCIELQELGRGKEVSQGDPGIEQDELRFFDAKGFRSKYLVMMVQALKICEFLSILINNKKLKYLLH